MHACTPRGLINVAALYQPPKQQQKQEQQQKQRQPNQFQLSTVNQATIQSRNALGLCCVVSRLFLPFTIFISDCLYFFLSFICPEICGSALKHYKLWRTCQANSPRKKRDTKRQLALPPFSSSDCACSLGIISGIIHVANICSRDFYELLRLQLRTSLRACGVVHANISGLHWFLLLVLPFTTQQALPHPPRPFLPQLKGLTAAAERDRERAREREREMLVLVGLGRLWQAAAEPKFTVKTHVTYFSRNYGKREKFR